MHPPGYVAIPVTLLFFSSVLSISRVCLRCSFHRFLSFLAPTMTTWCTCKNSSNEVTRKPLGSFVMYSSSLGVALPPKDRAILVQLQQAYNLYVQQQTYLHRLYQQQQAQKQTQEEVTPAPHTKIQHQVQQPNRPTTSVTTPTLATASTPIPPVVSSAPVIHMTPQLEVQPCPINFKAINKIPVRLPDEFPPSFDLSSSTKFPVETHVARAALRAPPTFNFTSAEPFFVYVNGVKRTLDTVDPTVTLNAFLRSLPGHKGTKRSCGEGGCGACTVLMSDPPSDANDTPTSFSINSCLRPLVSCYGKSITTVEGIGSQKKGYHPIQVFFLSHMLQCIYFSRQD